MPGSSAVEQVTVNHLVGGSIPPRAAILSKGEIPDEWRLVMHSLPLAVAAVSPLQMNFCEFSQAIRQTEVWNPNVRVCPFVCACELSTKH